MGLLGDLDQRLLPSRFHDAIGRGCCISTLAVVSIYLWPMISRPTVAEFPYVSTLAIVSAITCLGPGSFSMDCLFFGRRRIMSLRSRIPRLVFD